MDSAASESTIDIVRRKFAEHSLNATDVAKRARIKGDQGRRILNRNGNTTEETAALLLKTINEMISPETAAGDEGLAAPAESDTPIVPATEEAESGEITRSPTEPADVSEKPRSSLNAGKFRRGMAPAPFPEMELGSKVSPQDHDISPFDVFEKIENETVIEENMKRRAEERAAAEREADIAAIAEADDGAADQTPTEDTTGPGSAQDTAEVVAQQPIEDVQEELSEVSDQIDNEIAEDATAAEDQPDAAPALDEGIQPSEVSLRIVTSRAKGGLCRIVLEGDVPQDRVNEIIAMFMKEHVSS